MEIPSEQAFEFLITSRRFLPKSNATAQIGALRSGRVAPRNMTAIRTDSAARCRPGR
jgi:hypothetical protein